MENETLGFRLWEEAKGNQCKNGMADRIYRMDRIVF